MTKMQHAVPIVDKVLALLAKCMQEAPRWLSTGARDPIRRPLAHCGASSRVRIRARLPVLKYLPLFNTQTTAGAGTVD